MKISEEDFLDAAYNNDSVAIKLALSQGIDIETADEEGWTALCWAVNQGHLEATKVLVEHNANVNYQDSAEDESVLMIAIQAEEVDLELIQFLLDSGAKIDLQDSIGWSALSHAVNLDDVEIAEFFLKNGANPDISFHQEDEDYETPRQMIDSDEMESLFAKFPVK
ncbi:MAG: ankyrin repeat domain-containing protein [Candidatus Kapaibacteriota bacterium]|jgi:ankyrin repeat protein